MKNNSIPKTEKELQEFIKNNPLEKEDREYKLKPNN